MMKGQQETLLACTGKGQGSRSAELGSSLVQGAERWRRREGGRPTSSPRARNARQSSLDGSSSSAPQADNRHGATCNVRLFFL